ncbi:MAG: type I-B CRISPR-associated endonuclease Cas1b [Candidatus Nitrosocaldus sp.]|nr:type I-B CRISPR-associated endonuclease Cas1b [Candidatus Nitrosocaldus sp.]MDW8275658.1 type I-B CRISPR-associated endonuclease Cas1b [Candidatus Nitrosocaldus sp.]
MRDYYIFKSGRLRRHENTIELEFNDGKKAIPVNDIHSLHLFGEIDINTKLITFLNQHGIPIHFYNYYGYYSGSFYPRERLVSGFLLVKQVEHYLDSGRRLEIATELVNSALHNILSNLNHYKKNGKDVDKFIDAIEEERRHLAECRDIAGIMGIEGRAREHYYSSFDTLLRDEFRFEKRSRMPPGNMLNALISFGNSLLYATVLTEIYHTQLSPTISYLHEPGERRYSLALDISEVFKPVIVDRVIFNIVNKRIIKEEHFFEELNGCYLNDKGRRIFIEEYQKKLDTTLKHVRLKRHVSYQRLIRIECFKLVKHILGEKKYIGFKSSW